MHIITIRWKSGAWDFIHVPVHDMPVRHLNALRKADIHERFEIGMFRVDDTYKDALAYIKAVNKKG